MKKLYSLIVFISLATCSMQPMDPVRDPLFILIDEFVGNDALGIPTNWDAVFAILKKIVQEGNAFTVNEYFSTDYMTLLAKAAEDNNINAARRLILEYKAQPNRALKRNGMTPLMIACFNGNLEMIETLMELGADPYLQNNGGNSSFDFAEKYYLMNPSITNKSLLNALKAYAPK